MLVGCGSVAHAHLVAVSKFSHLAQLVATVDNIKTRARQAQKEFGAERAYFNLEPALADKSIQAAVLTLPHYLHAPVAIQALKAGKNVLVEKPMALRLKDAERMIAEAEKRNLVLMAGQSMRFSPAMLKARQLIRRGRIGQVVHMIARRLGRRKIKHSPWWNDQEKSGGILGHHGSHQIDLMLWLVDEEPVRVFASARSVKKGWNLQDECSLEIITEGGAIISLNQSFNSPCSTNDTIIVGTKGELRLVSGREVFLNEERVEFKVPQFRGIEAEHLEFYSSIKEKKEPEASGRDVRKTVAVLDAAQKSITSGRPVKITA
jgi:predicted dehydrogenase